MQRQKIAATYLLSHAMSIFYSKAFWYYLLGILAVALGAQLSSVTNSMLPLAMGSAWAIIMTAGLVKANLAKRRAKRRATRP